MEVKDFLEAGFTQHMPNAVIDGWANLLLEKKVYGKKGIKYFIHVFRSDIRGDGSEDFTTRLQLKRGKDVINIDVFPRKDHTVNEIESLTEMIWKKLGADYAKLNEE
jgi:hypothetical protein